MARPKKAATEPKKTVEETIAESRTVETLEQNTGQTETVNDEQVVVRPDVSRMFAPRAIFDTSGTAGEADHDLYRTAAVYDKDIKRMEEVPEHLQKQLDSAQSMDAIMDEAYRP